MATYYNKKKRQAVNLEKFRDIQFRTRKECVVCGQSCGDAVIEFMQMPITEVYVPNPVSAKLGYLDQAFYLCSKCGHGQITNAIDPAVLYFGNYETRTSNSSSAVSAIDTFVLFVESYLKGRPVGTLVEIGCNDLHTLQRFKKRAMRLIGIDPMLAEYPVEDKQIETIGDFVENIDFVSLGIKADVVLCSHTLEHIEKPKNLMQTLINNAGDETIFFFQFPGLEPLVHRARFDQVHHQHLNYFSLQSVIYMLEQTGAELIDYEFNHAHWGTLMIAFKRRTKSGWGKKFTDDVVEITEQQVTEGYRLFRDCMDATNRRVALLSKFESVYGFGAALMLPLLAYHVPEVYNLKCIIDDDSNKQGLYFLNVPCEIVPSESVGVLDESGVLITAMNSKMVIRTILCRLIDLHVRDIIVPANLI